MLEFDKRAWRFAHFSRRDAGAQPFQAFALSAESLVVTLGVWLGHIRGPGLILSMISRAGASKGPCMTFEPFYLPVAALMSAGYRANAAMAEPRHWRSRRRFQRIARP